jgi:CHAT domain-containing protein/tetratricopeptide (TPR) repeat protein
VLQFSTLYKFPDSRFYLNVIFLTVFSSLSASTGNAKECLQGQEKESVLHPTQTNNDSITEEIKRLNKSLLSLLSKGSIDRSRIVVDSIIHITGNNIIADKKILSESYYFIGVYYSFTKEFYRSIEYLNLSIELKESMKEYDERYSKALYNLGVAYNSIGDFNKLEEYSLKALDMEKKLAGEISPDLISIYLSLIAANIDLQEYEKAIFYANIALPIANNNPDRITPSILADLYSNLGVCYSRLSDFSKAIIFLDKSESIYRNSHLDLNVNYINLMNSMAITYGDLGLSEKSEEYYERGIELAHLNNSPLAYNIINSYAITLANSGKEHKGEALLNGALGRAKTMFGEKSHIYFDVLNKYAYYLRNYKTDNKKSLEYYKMCMDYLSNNQQDLLIKDPVIIGYTQSLAEAGESWKALETIQSLLFSGEKQQKTFPLLDNPGIELIKTDKKSLLILKTKYEILWDIYRKSPDKRILEAAARTSELVVSLLEKVRINISQEESRLVLGDRYRDSYLNAIRDFNLLYNQTADRQYLEKAFEYSEKCKVAGLLTSTRELKAAQFHIPVNIADFEKKLQKDISLINSRIAEELLKREPDTLLLNNWKENLLKTTWIRDSLVLVFEKQYPGYYALKYNTAVTKLKDIPAIAGRNGNYINYVLSDTMLYIFIANRIHQQILALPVDSVFFNNIKQFRSLLSRPLPSENARIEFEKFKLTGYELYKSLFEPVRKYLISEKLLISPDNILSYLPFESIPTSPDSGEKIMYRDLAYMMDDFDISYTYSATFNSEALERKYSIGNKVIAFAPDYPEPIKIQSVLLNRQTEISVLPDLPYARLEAEYVSDITGGKLYENKDAKESVYKAESGKYDIIHLAMHTLLNDKDPMHSTLIFSQEIDSVEDGYLKTYEVYGIPLMAKMVVLSSCNTGTGLLYSGEGILSLARGFIYSGSQSVVMSMWEVEDKSGTEIVKMFYDYLKRGNSKSVSLRKARLEYLKKADQLRSHPYFWSTLVVYGNNVPLYYSKQLIIGATALLIIVASLVLYFMKRRYS